MKMLRSALTTEKAVQQIDASRGKDDDSPSQRMATLGPVIEGLTRSVCDKYGFENGFQEAMQSIAAEGGKAQDEKLRGMIEEVGEAITGDKSPRSEYCHHRSMYRRVQATFASRVRLTCARSSVCVRRVEGRAKGSTR